jgi:hypothetical protein
VLAGGWYDPPAFFFPSKEIQSHGRRIKVMEGDLSILGGEKGNMLKQR